MPAVTLNKGKYWIGDPKLVLPDWKPSASHVYKCGPYTFHAFKFAGQYVAAIPFDGLEYATPSSQGAVMSFTKDTIFYEQDGNGKLDGVELGVLGEELQELIDNHIDSLVDLPKTKKTKSAQADKI